eukprot:997771-Prorocentrum_minimum.AAC.5
MFKIPSSAFALVRLDARGLVPRTCPYSIGEGGESYREEAEAAEGRGVHAAVAEAAEAAEDGGG